MNIKINSERSNKTILDLLPILTFLGGEFIVENSIAFNALRTCLLIHNGKKRFKFMIRFQIIRTKYSQTIKK
jgi:hypothetical protein